MHTIEPYFAWRHLYNAEEDEFSPFFGREYSEFEFTHSVYDHLIHPQWDSMGSATLYIKILFCNYDRGFAVIEMIGEWNDCLYNDIMYLKRNIVEHLEDHGINKFILVGENVLNFHSDDDSYYQEWFDDVEDGWIAGINFREHVRREFESANIDYYIALGGKFNELNWRCYSPNQLCDKVESLMTKRLTA
ncbi:MAG: hypothetical protein K9I94_06970 [Bacteroidales bacterium]|nr:hypothetical protein [Bacteroidales bacterium]